MNNLPFNLRSDEQIQLEIKPVRKLQNYYVFVLFIVISLVLACSFFGVVLIPFMYPFAVWAGKKQYEQRMYWITNKRVVYKRGLLGYRITSIPYNRISDVIISRTWLESKFGIASLNIQTLAGQISQNPGGAEGNLAGVPDPEDLQEKILENVEAISSQKI